MCRDHHRQGFKTPCSVKFLSFLIKVFALVFILAGLATVGVGIYVMIELGDVSDLSSTYLPVGLIVLGLAVVVLAMLMWCAASKKTGFLVTFCIVLLLCIIVAQIGVTIALFVQRGNISDIMKKGWDAAIKSSTPSKSNVEPIEQAFGCCGWSNATIDQDAGKLGNYCEGNKTRPFCEQKIDDLVENNIELIAIAGAILLAIEICGAFALFCMCCEQRTAKEDYDTAPLISAARYRSDNRRNNY